MKTKLIIAAFLLLATTATFAGEPKTGPALKSKTVSVPSNYKSVVIGNNLKVVFTNETNSEVTVSGSEKFVESVKISSNNGVLTITSKDAGKDGAIYIPSNNITQLDVKENSNVYSVGFLNLNKINISVGMDSKVALKTRGIVNIKPAEGTELDFEKFQTISE